MNMKDKILVVDDDPRLLRFVRANLESRGYRVTTAFEGVGALEAIEQEMPELIVLDIMLPGEFDGYELCARVRQFSTVPIIMLTARGDEQDKVKGLRLGADDYLTKPFSAQELLARVEAVLRRAYIAQESQPASVMTFGDLTIDLLRRRVTIRDQEVSLTPTEYKLISHLAAHAGRVMLHEDLLTRVWGAEYRDELDYLRAYVRYLRQKIEDDPHHPKYILSKPGVGYMLAVPA